MKKLTLVLGIAAISLVACKKETTIKADVADSDSAMKGTDPNAMAGAPAAQPMQNPQTPAAAPSPAVEQEALIAKAKQNPTTTLAISEKDFDFKDVKKGQSVDHKYEFTNTGKNPLIISEVKPGCGCTVPDYSKEPILPGKKGFVNLKFDSSSFDGKVNKYADVYANVDAMPIKLTFSANVVK